MLPRRVPWLPGEYELVHNWLFASDGDVYLQQRALDRISVWLTRSGCPQAVESTADLMDVLLQAGRGHLSPHSARLAYATCIIRFVNGLVDPVQQGYYARSIGSIAHQLGLPQAFVELRHAATHENLPSLTVLRDACQRALDWLYERYWLPSIQSADAQQSLAHEHLTSELVTLFRTYKAARKAAVRDATLLDPAAQDKLLMAIEKLAAGLRMQYGVAEGLEAVAEQLVAPGGLVPKGKRKRTSEEAMGMSVPRELVAIWTPLLDHLDDAFDGFSQVLLLRMLDVLCYAVEEDGELTSVSAAIGSSQLLLAAWTFLVIDRSPNIDDAREIAVRLCLLRPNAATLALLDALAPHVDGLQPLLPLAKAQAGRVVAPVVPENVDAHLDSMEARLVQLASAQAPSAGPTTQSMELDSTPGGALWQVIEAALWRPCPIGCLPDGRVPDLDYHPVPIPTL